MDKEIKRIKGFFKDLTFDEPKHIYAVKGKTLKASVSKVLKVFVDNVDFNKIAKNIDSRDGLPEGTTSTLWDLNSKISLSIGTRAHYFGELYAFHRNLIPTSGYEEAIVKFWDDIPDYIVPVVMELQMYHKDYMFAGTGDILLYNKISGKYIIGDYKTNKDLFKNHNNKTMLSPFNEDLDMPLNHYKLQLSFYQLLFEQTGLEVEERKVIWLKPDGTYLMYDTEDCTDLLKEHLKNNKI